MNTYEDTADASVVESARRMLSTARGGDLDASAAAADEATSACSRLGYSVPGPIGGGPTHCDPGPCF